MLGVQKTCLFSVAFCPINEQKTPRVRTSRTSFIRSPNRAECEMGAALEDVRCFPAVVLSYPCLCLPLLGRAFFCLLTKLSCLYFMMESIALKLEL